MWLKKIRKKKLQSILIVLIVSICSLLMCGSIVIITSLKNIRNIDGVSKPSSDEEVIIPKVMASEFNINLNDYIDITSGDKKYSYKVVGTFADPFSKNISFQSELLVTKIPDGLTKELELNIYMPMREQKAVKLQMII